MHPRFVIEQGSRIHLKSFDPGGKQSTRSKLPEPPRPPKTHKTSTVTLKRNRNPPPSTLNPQPYTLNPQPSTLNPQPSTLNPQPSTLHPQHSGVRGARRSRVPGSGLHATPRDRERQTPGLIGKGFRFKTLW